MTNKQLSLLVMAVLMVMPSCSRPVSSEQFVRNASRDAYGRYVFDVDMQDSLSCYDISLISAFSCIDRQFSRFSSMPLNLLWESPDGQVYENDLLVGRASIADSSYYDKALIVKAGERLEPVRYGRWKLYVKIPEDTVKLYGVTGMGIKVTRKTR